MTRFAPALLDQLRSALPMPSIVGGSVRLKRTGRSWSGLCPFHSEKSPSFAVYDDHFHCFGCGQHGDVFAWFQARDGVDFPAAVVHAATEAGMSLPDMPRMALRPAMGPPPAPPPPREPTEEELRDEAERREAARRIWVSASPVQDVVQAYLERRCLWPIPEAAHRVLRQARIRHPQTKRLHPAMVARVDGLDGNPVAVHRTYLTEDGRKLDTVEKSKLVLGNMRGGAIRLAPTGDCLGLAEGIETSLAVEKLHGVGTWACISASQLAAVELPFDVTDAVVFADRDRAKQFREGAGLHYARIAQDRHRRAGVRTEIRLPTEPWGDYADVWTDVSAAEAGWAVA